MVLSIRYRLSRVPCRDLPARYGPYTTAYNRFNRWSRRGIWKRIFNQLASNSGAQNVKDRIHDFAIVSSRALSSLR
jgi:transposase